MKTVKITETFDGYPNGKRVTFTKGDEVQVAATYADLIIEKGHAKEVAKAPEAKAETPVAKK